MFCPECHSEYRKGFTRCSECGVDLVEALSAPGARPAVRRGGPSPHPSSPLVDYCGFLALEEARQARGKLRDRGIRAEILIRESPGSDLAEPVQEEFWLRVPVRDFEAAASVLGYDSAERDGTVTCSSCGRSVAEEERFCPHCDARFEEG